MSKAPDLQQDIRFSQLSTTNKLVKRLSKRTTTVFTAAHTLTGSVPVSKAQVTLGCTYEFCGLDCAFTIRFVCPHPKVELSCA